MLVQPERAGEGVLRCDPRAQPRQPVEQHVHLHLAALGGRRRGLGDTPQASEHRGCHARQHVAGGDRVLVAVLSPGDLAITDVHHLGPGAQVGAGARRGIRERAGHRAHPAHRHPPAAVAGADHVPQEAAVLAQRRLVDAREGADQRVGRDHPAHEAVTEPLSEGLGERPVGDRLPRAPARPSRAGASRCATAPGRAASGTRAARRPPSSRRSAARPGGRGPSR